MGRLFVLALFGALIHSAPATNELHEHSGPAQISFDVPRSWVVDDEQELSQVGFIVPPEPLYALVASPAKTPAFMAFNPSPVPWLFVTVETDHDLLPPSQLYELAPQYLEELATQSGPASTEVKTLVAESSRSPRRPKRLSCRAHGRLTSRQNQHRRFSVREGQQALAGHRRLLGLLLYQ